MRTTPLPYSELQLTHMVIDILLNEHHLPFVGEVKLNKRLAAVGGRFHIHGTYQVGNDQYPFGIIELNPRVLYDKTVLVGVLRHELCHYYFDCFQHGQSHRTKVFQQFAHHMHALKYAPRWCGKYEYECSHCHQLAVRSRSIDLTKYQCRCGHALKLLTTPKATGEPLTYY